MVCSSLSRTCFQRFIADSQGARPGSSHSNNPQVFNNCGKFGPEKGEAKIAQTRGSVDQKSPRRGNLITMLLVEPLGNQRRRPCRPGIARYDLTFRPVAGWF